MTALLTSGTYIENEVEEIGRVLGVLDFRRYLHIVISTQEISHKVDRAGGHYSYHGLVWLQQNDQRLEGGGILSTSHLFIPKNF